LVGGSYGRYKPEETYWTFTNFITPSTPREALDDVSTTSSSSVDSQSTYTNDNDANEGEEEESDDGEVRTSQELRGGNRLVNLLDLDKALTSTSCCRNCAQKSHNTALDAFMDFCEAETKIY
jgi:hypothetical protein